jgi:adenylate cyclase
MPLKKSIGTRIFGLAIFLLLLTIALVIFLLAQVARMGNELQTLASNDVPIASSLSRVDEYGLRHRLAFERMFGALNSASPNEQILSEAQANYELFGKKVQDEIATARKLISDSSEQAEHAAEHVAFSKILDEVEAEYVPIIAREQEALDLQRHGEHDRATFLLEGLSDLQRVLQDQRAQLQTETARHAEIEAREALIRQSRIRLLSIAATVSTVLLGLVVAAWVTQGLVRPVRLLIGAMSDVQRGQLDLELPVRSSDEIGALTAAFNYFVSELRAKARIKETFGKYIDPRILDRVLTSSGPVEGAGERQVMTVGFGDLVGFTGCSERLTPSNMVRMLNRHFGLQSHAIQECEGIVDKFIGDAVMSFWGPPFVTPEEHARLACRAALAQLAAMDILRDELPELTGLRRDTPTVDLRIGLATGEVVVGNLGAETTRNYTVIGDAVNVASRIESVNRLYGTNILVNESVARNAGQDFEFRELDSIAVQGRSEAVRIYELLGPMGCLNPDQISARSSYEEGLRAYQSGDWEKARTAFQASLRLRHPDRAAEVMIERIATLSSRTDDSPWDGVWKLTEK